MKPLDALAEEAVLEMVERVGPCSLDDLVGQLPHFSWGEVFVAVDRMSRDGRLVIRQLGYLTYHVALSSRRIGYPVEIPL
jgi:hypothetical protein